VEVADIHGNGIQYSTRAAGYLLQTGDSFCIRRLIGDNAWNAMLQKVPHDRLAYEAQPARYQKFNPFAHWSAAWSFGDALDYGC
jgi:hypothetical protein